MRAAYGTVAPLPMIRLLLAVALLAGCANGAHSATRSSQPQRAAARVVTLMPSLADDLYAIGAGPQVVAVAAFTDVAQAKALPRVSDFSSVDSEKVVALHPDLVVGIPAQIRLVEPLRAAGVNVVLLPDSTLAQIFVNLRTLGALTGHEAQARRVIAGLRQETATLHARTLTFKRRPSAFVVLGTGPIWTAGSDSYIASLIELAGGINAANDLHAPYGEYSAEALLRKQPDDDRDRQASDQIVVDALLHAIGDDA